MSACYTKVARANVIRLTCTDLWGGSLTNIAKALNIKGGTLAIATATDLLPTLIRMLGAPGEDSIHVCFIVGKRPEFHNGFARSC